MYARGIISTALALTVACSASTTLTSPGTSDAASPSSTARPASRYSAYSNVAATTQPPGSVLITMSNYAFTPSTLALPAGKVVLFLVNTSTEIHALSLREPGQPPPFNVVAVSDRIDAGKSAVLTIDSLPVGVYQAACPVEDHAARGMVADVTAK